MIARGLGCSLEGSSLIDSELSDDCKGSLDMRTLSSVSCLSVEDAAVLITGFY